MREAKFPANLHESSAHLTAWVNSGRLPVNTQSGGADVGGVDARGVNSSGTRDRLDAAAQTRAASTKPIRINKLDVGVIRTVLANGRRDFAAAPWFGLFFGLLYTSAGWAVVMLATATGYYYLAYPLAAGFALIAPFIAAGLYHVSQKLEMGSRPSWSQVFPIVFGAGARDLGWMALVTGFIFFIWLDIAFFLYAIFFGFHVQSFSDLVTTITSSWNGLSFFLVGNIVGALIAFFVFSLTVISIPMLLDRDIDFVTAMITSVRAVRTNPKVMFGWAVTIALFLFISLATALVGLILLLPILGHASWHMYRASISPDVSHDPTFDR